MKLDEWIELSPDDRNAHRRRWERDSGDWMDLLSEARTRFESKFRSHPLINYICQSAWHAASYEPSILVTTALYSPQLIEELPDRFCTFRVVQEQVLDNRDFYLRYWTLVFDELLGWSEAQTRKWARKWDDDLNGRKGSMFYHEDPYYYALPVVIHESLPPAQAEARRSMALFTDVLRAIQSHGSEPIWLSPYDWDAARERVNAVLIVSGGRLPR
ncbi:MAG TPA: hypothetical protein VFU86_02680 [Terriglobales bacterium]|nr:hypothetical protein [Terriglobales bacterium]